MKPSPRAKILIAVLLLVAAVAAWYVLYTQGQQAAEVSPPPPPPKPVPAEKAKAATSTSARALEILPLPFLVTKAPEEAPPPPAAEKPEVAEAPPKEAVEAPPNPFVPLPQRQKAILASKQPPAKPKPAPSTEKPVAVRPVEAPELVRVPVPRLVPPPTSEPVLPPEARIGAGALPIRLEPVEKEVAPAPAKAQASPKQPRETSTNPLKDWAEAQGLKLSGVALGPVSVAIFKTSQGFVTLAVGEFFPETQVRLKSVGPNYAILEQGKDTLKVSSSKPSGGGK